MGWDVDDDYTPREIGRAIDRDDLIEVRRLFEVHPEFLRNSRGFDTWLWEAAYNGNLPLVKLLMDLGLSVNEPMDEEMPEGPIDSAAAQGQLEVVEWLLEHGAKVNHVFQGKRRCIAMFGASRNGHLDVVKLLVKHGAESMHLGTE